MLVCSWPPTKLSEGMTYRHGHTWSTSHFLRRWVTPGREWQLHFFFFLLMRNPLPTQASFTPWNLGGGHLTGAASYWARPCARDPKTSESSNDQIKSAERTSNVRGTRATGRLQTTQEKGRQFSAVRRLTPSRRALQAAALSLPDGRHGFTFLPHAPALASDALRPHRQQQQQVPRQLLLCSGTRRPGARPHTPRKPAAPAEPAPRADWPRREEAGAPPTAGGRR